MLLSRSRSGNLARWWFTVDRGVLAAALLLMAAGVLVSMAASPPVAERLGYNPFHFIKSQMSYLLVSAVILIAASFLDRLWVRRLGILMFLGSLVLMLLALEFGTEIKGAHRWIDLGLATLQPSELAKPAFIVFVSWFLAERLRQPDMPGHLIAYASTAMFVALLVAQPDFGQTVLVLMTFGAILLVYGAPWRVIFALGGATAIMALVAYLLVPHVSSRVERYLNPEVGDTFQVDTAVEALRNGGVFGAGPGGGTAKLVLPDAHTDFAFAVVGEEFGAIACLVIMALFLFVVIRVLNRARTEADPFAALAATGLVVMFGFQGAINMGVNVALLPAKGMTLPFISYGGSSLLGTALAVGFILALGRKVPRYEVNSAGLALKAS
jgi:cell division protein FtsW